MNKLAFGIFLAVVFSTFIVIYAPRQHQLTGVLIVGAFLSAVIVWSEKDD